MTKKTETETETIALIRAERLDSKTQRWADARGRWWLVREFFGFRLTYMPTGATFQALRLSDVLAGAADEFGVTFEVEGPMGCMFGSKVKR